MLLKKKIKKRKKITQFFSIQVDIYYGGVYHLLLENLFNKLPPNQNDTNAGKI